MIILDYLLKILGFEVPKRQKKIKQNKRVERKGTTTTYNLNTAEKQTEIDGIKIVNVYSKKELDEILTFVKRGEPVLGEFQAQKENEQFLAFLEGAMVLLEGKIKKMNKNLYIFLPEGTFLEDETEN